MDDAGAGLLVFGLADPHGLEGRQRRQDRATDPHQELPLGGSQHLDLHGRRGQSSHFLAQTLGDAGEHSGAAGHDDVRVEIFSDVHIALEDGLVGDLMEAGHFLADHHGLEEGLRAAEALAADGVDLAVGEFVLDVIMAGVFFGYVKVSVQISSAS